MVAERITESATPAPRTTPVFSKLLIRNGGRNLIVDAQELIYATIDNGVITLVTGQIEGQSNFRTLEDLQAALDSEMFWRAHRSFVVNINRIRGLEANAEGEYEVVLDRGTRLRLSRRYMNQNRNLTLALPPPPRGFFLFQQ